MFLIAVSVGTILSALPKFTDPLPVEVIGTARLVWRQHDLPLQTRGKKVTRMDLARVFVPPSAAAAQTGWEIRGAKVSDLIFALHDHPWDAGEQATTYASWLGTGPRRRTVTVEGVIEVTRVGDRLNLVGTARATDEGFMSDRFGPNWWRDKWEHRFGGQVRVNRDGQVVSVELTDEFEVAGAYFDPKQEDRNTRSGRFRLSVSRPNPITNPAAPDVGNPATGSLPPGISWCPAASGFPIGSCSASGAVVPRIGLYTARQPTRPCLLRVSRRGW